MVENFQASLDRNTYQNYLAQEALIHSSVEYQSDYRKYVILAYLYVRSRLDVPGRCYEDEDHGPLALGSPMHCDVIDLDVWLSKQDSERLSKDVLEWINDASPEQIAYFRGLSRPMKRANMSRIRSKITKRISE